MAVTVKQLIEELGGIADGSDPTREGALVLFEGGDGDYYSIDESAIRYHNLGLPDAESDMPVLVLGDGGVVEIE